MGDVIYGTAHRSRSIARATLPSPPSLPFAALACITFVYRVLSASYPKLIVDSLVVGGSGAMRSMGASIALHHTRSLPPSPRRLPPLPSPQSLPSLALPMPFALDSLLQLIVTYKGEGGGGVGATQSQRILHRARPPPKPIFSTPQALLPLDSQDVDVSLCCCLSWMRTEQRKEGKCVDLSWSVGQEEFLRRAGSTIFWSSCAPPLACAK